MAGTVLPWIMGVKWGKENLDQICISFIGYEGSTAHAKRQRKLVEKIMRKHGGLTIIGTGPGILYDQKKFDTPYLRDFLLDMGAAGDVSETAAPWSKLNQVHDAAYAAAQGAYDEIGIKGWIMSHMCHSYHSGACLYFTFAFVFKNDPIAEYNLVKNAIQQSFVDNDATISHHHGVGRRALAVARGGHLGRGRRRHARAVRRRGCRRQLQPRQDASRRLGWRSRQEVGHEEGSGEGKGLALSTAGRSAT